jgi:predicted cupin superfamily sugar epimerase
MIRTAQYWIGKLQLIKHPEGGYYREVYRSNEFVHKKNLPDRYSSFRSFSTSIYFLLEGSEFSSFHRLKSDEIWHFYEGSAIHVLMIFPNGEFKRIVLGQDFESNQVYQAVIPKGCWFAAQVNDPESFSLVGCTVSPGFDFEDFEMGKKGELLKLFPQHEALITTFTR